MTAHPALTYRVSWLRPSHVQVCVIAGQLPVEGQDNDATEDARSRTARKKTGYDGHLDKQMPLERRLRSDQATRTQL